MSDDFTRCPRCGKRLPAEALVCPGCSFEFLLHHERIRCNSCHRRIPTDASICPQCGADPRAGRFPFVDYKSTPVRVAGILFGLLLLLCMGWVIFRALTTNTLARAFGLIEPTATMPAQVVQVIYVVATSPPPTPTRVILPTATSTPRFSPTPTRRAVRTAIPVTPTPAFAPGTYPAPQLLGPANATVYTGVDAIIVLEWQPVSAIGPAENEWYRITISYTSRDGKPIEQIRWTKETRWTVLPAWWSDTSSDTRTFKWTVSVVRSLGIDPFSSNTTPISAPSLTRSFIWN